MTTQQTTARLSLAAFASAAALSLAVPAAAQGPAPVQTRPNGFYASGNLGAQLGWFGEQQGGGFEAYRTGPDVTVGASFGYEFGVPSLKNGRVRTEFEGAWTPTRTRTEMTDEYHWNEYLFLANAWYEWEMLYACKPYIGGGVGVGFVDGLEDDLDGDIGLAYQFGGGIRHDITDDGRFFGGVGYRYTVRRLSYDGSNYPTKAHRLMFEIGTRLNY